MGGKLIRSSTSGASMRIAVRSSGRQCGPFVVAPMSLFNVVYPAQEPRRSVAEEIKVVLSRTRTAERYTSFLRV